MTLWVVKGGRAGEREDRFLDHAFTGNRPHPLEFF